MYASIEQTSFASSIHTGSVGVDEIMKRKGLGARCPL